MLSAYVALNYQEAAGDRLSGYIMDPTDKPIWDFRRASTQLF